MANRCEKCIKANYCVIDTVGLDLHDCVCTTRYCRLTLGPEVLVREYSVPTDTTTRLADGKSSLDPLRRVQFSTMLVLVLVLLAWSSAWRCSASGRAVILMALAAVGMVLPIMRSTSLLATEYTVAEVAVGQEYIAQVAKCLQSSEHAYSCASWNSLSWKTVRSNINERTLAP